MRAPSKKAAPYTFLVEKARYRGLAKPQANEAHRWKTSFEPSLSRQFASATGSEFMLGSTARKPNYILDKVGLVAYRQPIERFDQ